MSDGGKEQRFFSEKRRTGPAAFQIDRHEAN